MILLATEKLKEEPTPMYPTLAQTYTVGDEARNVLGFGINYVLYTTGNGRIEQGTLTAFWAWYRPAQEIVVGRMAGA